MHILSAAAIFCWYMVEPLQNYRHVQLDLTMHMASYSDLTHFSCCLHSHIMLYIPVVWYACDGPARCARAQRLASTAVTMTTPSMAIGVI